MKIMNNNDYKILNVIKYKTVPEIIANTLRESILLGEISGGTQLKQDELAGQLNVSMSALREALKKLEAEGLVMFYPNRGVEVIELSAQEAEEIFEIRSFLEVGALGLAIPNFTAEDLQAAEKILKQISDENNAAQCHEANWQFHKTLYLPANRPRLMHYIQIMYNNVARYMRLYFSAEDYRVRAIEEHQKLLDACARKDIKSAQELLREHISDTSKVLIERLK